MKFLKEWQAEPSTMWNGGQGAVRPWPLAFQSNHYDVWDVGDGRPDRFMLLKGWNNKIGFPTLEEAIAYADEKGCP